MSEKVGMNPAVARGVVASVAGLAGGLSTIESEVNIARSLSLNPLNFMLSPGSLILSPVSIGLAASASADLANVRQSLDYLVLKLSQEITQQEQVSNSLLVTDPGWFATPPDAKRPDDIGIFEREWEFFQNFVGWGQKILLGFDAAELFQMLARNMPPWYATALKWVVKVGKFIPGIGVGFSVAAIFTEWNWNNPVGNLRNFISLGLDIVPIVLAPLLIPPATIVGAPAEAVVLGIGIAWDVVDLIFDELEANSAS